MGAKIRCPCKSPSSQKHSISVENQAALARSERKMGAFQVKRRREKKHNKMGQTFPKHKLPKNEIRRLQRYVSFSEDEIKDWYQEFCHSIINRRQHDLFLSEEEFVKVYNCVYPGQGDEFARHIFRTFDLDGDNRVDFREFLIGLSFSGSEDKQKQLSWAFQVYDVKRTGFITQESMTQIIRAVFKMIGPQTLRHNNVTITAESMADELFRQMDQDGDQRVSWLEFREAALKNPMAVQLLQCSPPESMTQTADDSDTVFNS